MSNPHALPPLPWDESALAPVISARTVAFHYGKHHAGYVDKTNAALAKRPDLAALRLDRLVVALARDPADRGLFNNAAQVWNHNVYWRSLRPDGGGAPPASLADRMKDAFGDVAACKAALRQAAVDQFGTGYAWLAAGPDRRLQVLSTDDAGTPLTMGLVPLLAIDVWEHAYYLDYQHARAAHVDAVLDKLVNWEFAAEALG